jgi:xanthine dehydrogenase accessory factor
MKELPSIIAAYRLKPIEERAALATVISVEGSSYRRPGARLFVTESGRWTGGISGGCLEGDALQKARRAMLQNRASTVVYDTREPDEQQIGVGLGCNGRIEILMAPLGAENSTENPINIWAQIMECRIPRILVTLVAAPENCNITPGAMWQLEEGKPLPDSIHNTPLAAILNDALAQVWQKGKSMLCKTEAYSAFVELWQPPVHLAIFGGHYDIHPLIGLAKSIGCKVSVTANLQKTIRDFVAGADELFQAGKSRPETDSLTAIVLMAHDYATDLDNLRWAISTTAPYIGLLGPRVRTLKLLQTLEAEGIPPNACKARIFGPAGLDIGASTPETIGLSIIAEVQACFAHRTGGHLRYRQTPIYEDV